MALTTSATGSSGRPCRRCSNPNPNPNRNRNPNPNPNPNPSPNLNPNPNQVCAFVFPQLDNLRLIAVPLRGVVFPLFPAYALTYGMFILSAQELVHQVNALVEPIPIHNPLSPTPCPKRPIPNSLSLAPY